MSKLETFGVPQGYSIAWNELEKIIDVVSAYQKKYISENANSIKFLSFYKLCRYCITCILVIK